MKFSYCLRFQVYISYLMDGANNWILCKAVFLENLIVARLVKKLPEFDSTWRSVAVCIQLATDSCPEADKSNPHP
jgi:hypothetical protein